jgi:glucan phosphoethanolaminetransferase (alkaline phosphatase superfamily)
MAGYTATQDSPYEGRFLMSALFLPLILIGCLVIYLIAMFIIGFRYMIPSIAFFVISFLFMFLLIFLMSDMSPAKGYYDYVKMNVDVGEIHASLMDYEREDNSTKYNRLFEEYWPECIKVLKPDNVLLSEKDSIKYVRVVYFFGPSQAFGLCVMEEPTEIPAYDPDDYSHRIKLDNNAFIWDN